LSDNDVNLSV